MLGRELGRCGTPQQPTSHVLGMLSHNFAMLWSILCYLFAFVLNSPSVSLFPHFNFIVAVLAIFVKLMV